MTYIQNDSNSKLAVYSEKKNKYKKKICQQHVYIDISFIFGKLLKLWNSYFKREAAIEMNGNAKG